MKILANYYQQCDADFNLNIPAEGYGGWQQAEIEIAPPHTAVVVMHAWDTGTREDYPGWHRMVEYIPRADAICRTVFPPLLRAVRQSNLTLFHVVSGNYYQHLPGYQRAARLAGAPRTWEQVESDATYDRLQALRHEKTFGAHNQEDVRRGFARIDFPPEARPQPDEGIAENSEQLLALCREAGINHLIYAGFAINYCLLWSPGGMIDMVRHGLICSALRQAVTAVENKESARDQRHKESALWSVALAFGFVFDVPDFISALESET